MADFVLRVRLVAVDVDIEHDQTLSFCGRDIRGGLRSGAAVDASGVHAAIAARADYEHPAIMRGDTWRGTFGQYQLALWWRTEQ